MLELVVDNTKMITPQQLLPDPVVVYRSNDVVDVLFAKLLLSGEGISFATSNEQAHSVFPGIMPVYFFVAHDEAAIAHSLLETYQKDRDTHKGKSHLQLM